jgi:hypothetical protein
VGASASLGVGSLRVAPWLLERTTALTRLAAEVTIVGEAGSKIRLGIWGDDGTGYPGALVVDAGQINGDSATVQEATINVTLTPGTYWLGAAVQTVTTTQPTVRTVGAGNPPHIPLAGGSTLPAAGALILGVSVGGATGAFAATYPAGGSPTGFAPRMIVKVA